MAFRNEMNQPQQQGAAQPGFWDWLKSPEAGALMGGLSEGLFAKMQDRNNPIVPTVVAGTQRGEEEAKKQLIAQKLSDPNFLNDPDARKQLASVLFSMGDPKSLELATKLAFPSNGSNSGFSLAPGAVRYDAQGNVIASRKDDISPSGRSSQTRGELMRWTSLPVDWRSNTLAIGNALGYSARETEDAFIAGKSLEDMAKDKGLPADILPDPAYPPTKAQINAIQQRRGAQAEIEVLDKFITPAQAPYAQRVNGFPVQLAADSISADPKAQERVSDYVAAKMLQVEGFAARFKTLGGNVSEAAIDKLMQESLADFKIPGIVITPNIWEKASKKVTQKILEAGQAANKVTLRSGMKNPDKYSVEDIQATMDATKLTKEEVLARLDSGE